MQRRDSLDPAYFETMFRGSADPWNFESSPYEAAKYRRTAEALGNRQYEQGFEAGCANGVLTRDLAPLCAFLLAIDVSTTALAAARKRCIDLPQVVFAEMVFPKQTPQQRGFDLVLLSEVAYYWDDGDLARAGEWLGTSVAPGGDILLVHWTGETDYPQTGDAAVQKLHAALVDKIDVVTEERHPGYRLDLWRRAP